jgi:hypothetical protein
MSVRTGVGAEARVKRKMVSNAGPSTPSKTPRRTANFDTVALSLAHVLSFLSCCRLRANLQLPLSHYIVSHSGQIHCIQKVQKLANQKLSDHDIARHPSLNGLNLTPAKVSIMRCVATLAKQTHFSARKFHSLDKAYRWSRNRSLLPQGMLRFWC